MLLSLLRGIAVAVRGGEWEVRTGDGETIRGREEDAGAATIAASRAAREAAERRQRDRDREDR